MYEIISFLFSIMILKIFTTFLYIIYNDLTEKKSYYYFDFEIEIIYFKLLSYYI